MTWSRLMIPPYRFALTCCIGLLLPAAFSVRLHAAQEAPIVPVPFDGTEAFGHILHSFDLKPVLTIEDAVKLAPKTLVIIFGDLRKLDTQAASVIRGKKFRAQGGALLVASDYADSGRLPSPLSGQGQRVKAHQTGAYKGIKDCPVVRRFPDRSHPLFKDVKNGLATNRPSFLEENPVGMQQPQRLAEFSDDCVWLARGGELRKVPQGAGYIFGSPKNAPPEGRMLVLAGQGVFLNGMLIQTDNDNFAFAWNTIAWLAEGPGGRREYALFIDDGKVISNFAMPLSRFGPVPIPPIQVINRMIRGLEDENIFNRLLMDNLGKEPYLRGLLLVGSVMALLWGAWRLAHGRFRLDTGVPLIVGKQETGPPALPVLWQRQEELRRLGNLWEPAQVLARQFFLDHAGLVVPLWDNETAAPPPVATSGNFWQRRTLKRQVQALWSLARSSPYRSVSPRQFDDLLRLVALVSVAVRKGGLCFQHPIQY